ncbi:2Fe-2S iron-sulfur cluster-binding protein [Proteiniborus sp. MB09-C3]|uniref:2Fe-2S iron-sulfur cluster-binding protein n=1 Tax=Proteiniborus sp. MB09-C3 TaxID=3050072 RepID=UPI0025570BBE|nr:2Fe-2S iron-sulfur cluster-binding protein [Proteiniborus sp. MB09-C3]WIV12583.1 2Fe-2S iron-sulfur cluster-binding protein [Proteiniborus sp. MB09-C3]
MNFVTLTIDDQKVTVPENLTVLQAAEKLGIEIPALCYDKDLEIVSSCRLCIVEIKGNTKLQTSCSTIVSEGMVVYTESDKVVKTRKTILQLLLDNHPNDCLTCEKSGECLLQRYAYRYDVRFREHNGERRKELTDTSSPYILKEGSKCILCSKCIRTCAQVSDRQVLSFAGRGFDTRVVADADFSLEESKCVSCNRCVSVCPTGALIDKRAASKGRVWDFKIEEVKCNSCQYGCDFQVMIGNEKKVAVKAKKPGVGRPLCLKGRLMTELLYVDNPEQPFTKKDGKFSPDSWSEVLGITKVIEKIELAEGKKGKGE